MHIRPATPDDAAAILAIYAPCVRDTTISFEETPPTEEEMAARIRKASASWAWLVAEQGNQLLGYAYGSAHRERAAYRYSTEVSVYVAPAAHRRGVGRALYEALFPLLAARGYCTAFAGIALPNEASLALHRGVGFEPIGVCPRVGFKFGAFRDVAWLHRPLRDQPLPGGSVG